MKLGVIGLPNVGKSTLFNAITKAGAQAANYPFCTIEPNVGIVNVPDERLEVLNEMYHPKSLVPAQYVLLILRGLFAAHIAARVWETNSLRIFAKWMR